jgi:hypothetical protein
LKLVYINNGKSTVFDSQVLALLKYYTNNNFFEEVILLFGYQNDAEIEWLKKKDTKGITIHYYKSFPNYPFFNYLIKKNLAKLLREIPTDFSDCFFHIRGEMTAYHVKKVLVKLDVKKHQVLIDVRGVSIQELLEYSTSNKIIKWFKLRNYNNAFNDLKKDLKVSVVSKFFKKYLISSLEINESSIFINSCLINENFEFNQLDRTKIRKDLGINDSEILLIFTSGGTANWQNNDMIMKLADKGIRVLNLSKRVLNYKNVITKFVDYKEVPSYLSAADIAFIWRDNSIVNKVASPVKVSEYMGCGLPIIHNGTVDLINEVTNHKKDALRIQDIDDLDMGMLNGIIGSINRHKLSEKGRLLFGLATLAKSYKRIYFNVK